MDLLRESVKDIAKSEEDVLLCALFPQVAPGFLKKRDGVQEVKEVTVDWVD
jgi:oxaloacetate decarboxylase alpha subunit